MKMKSLHRFMVDGKVRFGAIAAAVCLSVAMVSGGVLSGVTPVLAAQTASDEQSEVITVTYEDGVDGEVFQPIQISIPSAHYVPDIGLTPTRNGFVFAGWTPSAKGVLAEKDVTYTATWRGDDSLTQEDRDVIAKKADETKSVLSVNQVGGEVTAGEVYTEKSSSMQAETVDGVVSENPAVADGSAIAEQPEEESVSEQGEEKKKKNKAKKKAADTPVDEPSGEIVFDDDADTDAEVAAAKSGKPEAATGKQDVVTEDVKTGDVNLPMYFGIGAGMVTLIGAAAYVLRKKDMKL